jgi:hypothetical protein
MEHAGRHVSTDFCLAAKAAAVGTALWYIAQRALAILGFLVFTYGLLAAEVELAKLEQVTAATAQ